MTEYEKMCIGKIYDPNDAYLVELKFKAHRLNIEYNRTLDEESQKRAKILDELLPNRKEGTYLQGPIYFDYGINTSVGKTFMLILILLVLIVQRLQLEIMSF